MTRPYTRRELLADAVQARLAEAQTAFESCEPASTRKYYELGRIEAFQAVESDLRARAEKAGERVTGEVIASDRLAAWNMPDFYKPLYWVSKQRDCWIETGRLPVSANLEDWRKAEALAEYFARYREALSTPPSAAVERACVAARHQLVAAFGIIRSHASEEHVQHYQRAIMLCDKALADVDAERKER